MSDTVKQSPLGLASLSALLNNTGLRINKATQELVGVSHSPADYTLGSVCSNTCLRLLTYAIHDAYTHRATKVSLPVYQNLYSIGYGTIPALGNSKAVSYSWDGYPNWNPYSPYNEVSSWGYVRLFALQAYNEFNFNSSLPEYKDFLSYFAMANSFVKNSNTTILTMENSKTFSPAFSNVDDMISADIIGVNKATMAFGQDLVNSGQVIDLSKIDIFGLPSNLLITLKQHEAITTMVSTALLISMTPEELTAIYQGQQTSAFQEKMIYEAFVTITGLDLTDVLVPVNCVTIGLNTLADLLSPEKLFPTSKTSLTVPVYDTSPTATGSKIYYPIYDGQGVNPLLETAEIKEQIGSKIVVSQSNEVGQINANYVPPMGFGSYVRGMIPDDVAVAAGAFGVAMSHINNIKSVQVDKLGQLLMNLETTKGLDLISAQTSPVDVASVAVSLEQIALGSGPYDTYTMSDFLGCMSGLPYPWASIQNYITTLETPRLNAIYGNLYLATTWEGATAEIAYDTRSTEVSGVFTYEYRISGVSMVSQGGGYSRNGATAPLVAISGGTLTGAATVGTDSTNVTTYGRVVSVALTGADGSWNVYDMLAGPIGGPAPAAPPVTGLPTIQIECPPDSQLGSTNTPYGTSGWTGEGWPADTGYTGTLLPGSIWKYVNDTYIAANNQRIIADTADGPFTISLPANPDPGCYVIITDGANWLTNSLTIGRNGSTLEGRDMDMLVDAMGVTLEFIYTMSTWHVTATYLGRDLPLPGVSGYSGYSGISGWNGMNDIIQVYIDQANAEISTIKISNPIVSGALNKAWFLTGIQLSKEQRAIATGISTEVPLTDPTVRTDSAGYPNQQYSFVDSIGQYAVDTTPHMAAPTLEAIADLETIGGQSIVATMRQSRNQVRLMTAGIPLDNNISNTVAFSMTSTIVPSTLTVKYLSGILLPATYTPTEAIADITACNCLNWG